MTEVDTAILAALSDKSQAQLLELQAHYDARCRAPGDTKPHSIVEILQSLIAIEFSRLFLPVPPDSDWRRYGSTAADLQAMGWKP